MANGSFVRRFLVPVAIAVFSATAFATPYYQTNLVSSIPGLASNTDPNLKNPWGMSFSNTSPFWVSNQFTNTSTVYNASGGAARPPVAIPTTATGPQGPTGTVFNGTPAFELQPGQRAFFLFSTLSGEIAGWNPSVNMNSAVAAFIATDNAVYTGLAQGVSVASPLLYAADFANGKIDVINGSFQKISLSGSFTDPTLPAGYVPYNVQNLNGQLYVAYSKVDPVTHRALEAPNQGIVDIFDLQGNFVRRMVTESHLSAPWGFAIAPSNFGSLSGALLVGNEGDGTIAGFDPLTGTFLETISDINGKPIVNEGLWGLAFRSPTSGFNSSRLFFAAGIEEEEEGLFGTIQVVPEPGTFAFVALAVVLLAGLRCVRYRSTSGCGMSEAPLFGGTR
jgi:uncharacterized protein (TIGR03118 family)